MAHILRSHKPGALALAFVVAVLTFSAFSGGAAYASANTSCSSTKAKYTWTVGHKYNPGDWCISNSSDGVRVKFQSDGNLVMYSGAKSGGKALWSSHTYNAGASYIYFKKDGSVVIYTASGGVLWASHTADSSRTGVTYGLAAYQDASAYNLFWTMTGNYSGSKILGHS